MVEASVAVLDGRVAAGWGSVAVDLFQGVATVALALFLRALATDRRPCDSGCWTVACSRVCRSHPIELDAREPLAHSRRMPGHALARTLGVLIADPYRLTLESIRETLEAADHLEVVGEALSAADLLATLKVKRPDVVLLDLDLPDMEGLACLGLIRENHPTVKVVMLAAEREPARIEAALRGGAIACVLKSVEPADLASAVRQAVQETVYTAVAPDESDVPDPVQAAGLTEREVTMLRLLARGLSNKAIGQELWVTEPTVKFHLNNLYRKLGVPNRTAAARFAYTHGLTGEG